MSVPRLPYPAPCRGIWSASGQAAHHASPIIAGSASAFIIPLRRRLTLLACVCKRWARIVGQPSAAWAHVAIDLYELRWSNTLPDPGERPLMDTRCISAWFYRCSTSPHTMSCWGRITYSGMRVIANG